MEIEKGALYVVATPIGNLGDISERARETLKNVDFIAAEDTRVTGILLKKFDIKNKQISYHEHNIVERSTNIISRLEKGESCAIVSDAGTPCISDPGEELISLCVQKQIPIYVIPGACALISALAISGLNTKRFCFEGFLSVTKKQRITRLNSLKNIEQTLIFYEAPHKLKTTLNDLYEVLGNRKIAVCRELTKIYEEVIRGSIFEIIQIYEDKNPKGEFVLVVEGMTANDAHHNITLTEAAQSAIELHETGESLSAAAKTVSAQTGLRKSEIYREAVEILSKKEK
ncbi:MAG: 16S rRNA (cytidine(1402)-2'-O)-methyltransferase [Oscillospiraceae bacterium]|nr:16S rRNA (cytidine(1402)-2'-O)-methyltransferase [Oscillospiraceae bacterium]